MRGEDGDGDEDCGRCVGRARTASEAGTRTETETRTADEEWDEDDGELGTVTRRGLSLVGSGTGLERRRGVGPGEMRQFLSSATDGGPGAPRGHSAREPPRPRIPRTGVGQSPRCRLSLVRPTASRPTAGRRPPSCIGPTSAGFRRTERRAETGRDGWLQSETGGDGKSRAETGEDGRRQDETGGDGMKRVMTG